MDFELDGELITPTIILTVVAYVFMFFILRFWASRGMDIGITGWVGTYLFIPVISYVVAWWQSTR